MFWPAFAFYLVAISLVAAHRTTTTQTQCQTLWATDSPYAIASHTKTITTNAPDVTIAFITQYTTTIELGARYTYTRTQTSIATVTETATQQVQGDVFSTTTTLYSIRTRTHNVTSTISKPWIVAEPYTDVVDVWTPNGFYPLDYTAPPPEPTPEPQPEPSMAADQIVYVMVQGKLLSTPLSAVSALMSATTSPDPLVTSSSASQDEADLLSLFPYFTEAASSDQSATTTATPQAQSSVDEPVHYQRLFKRDNVRDPKALRGLRGVMSQSSAHMPVAFPSLVSCTKSYVVENTVWRPTLDYPTYVAPTPATTTLTTLSSLTLTSTVPDRTASSTALFVVTSTITTTTTYEATFTALQNLTYTVHLTSTSYHACATPNILGPRARDDAHIVNVYSKGLTEYTTFDVGFSTSAEDCCIECHTMERPCMGSVFTAGQCLLITHSEGFVCRPEGTAGYYVTRSRDDSPMPGHSWPDYVLSNGPCGAFHDAGTGW